MIKTRNLNWYNTINSNYSKFTSFSSSIFSLIQDPTWNLVVFSLCLLQSVSSSAFLFLELNTFEEY